MGISQVRMVAGEAALQTSTKEAEKTGGYDTCNKEHTGT